MCINAVISMISHPVFRLICVQVLVVSTITVLCAVIAGLQASLSAMLGSLIVALLNSWSVWRLTTRRTQTLPTAAQTLRRYYWAEAIKLLLLLLLLVMLLRPEQPLARVGLELDKAFLMLGLVLTALLIAVPNARILSGHYFSDSE